MDVHVTRPGHLACTLAFANERERIGPETHARPEHEDVSARRALETLADGMEPSTVRLLHQ